MIKELKDLVCKYPQILTVLVILLLVALVILRELSLPNTENALQTSTEPTVDTVPDLPVDLVLTTEQAKKVVEDKATESDCLDKAIVGEPGTENAIWDDEVKIPVLQAYRGLGQEVTPDTESFLYDLAQSASYKSEIEKLPEQEVLASIQSWILDYTKFQIKPNLTDNTPKAALEVGVKIFHPAFIERARTKCASLYREDGMEEDRD